MPRLSGREALAIIRSAPQFHYIPVVILTTSRAEEDIIKSYPLGASSYIAKPVKFDDLVSVVRTLGDYWFQIVELPPKA